MIVNNELDVDTSGCGLRVGALMAVVWRLSEKYDWCCIYYLL